MPGKERVKGEVKREGRDYLTRVLAVLKGLRIGGIGKHAKRTEGGFQ